MNPPVKSRRTKMSNGNSGTQYLIMLETNGVRLIINSNGVSTVSTYLLGGGLAGLVTTGSLKGMLIGAVSGAVFAGIGNAFSAGGKFSGSTWVKGGQLTKYGKALKTGLHGVAGGARSVLSGGKFKAGFLSAGFTQFASPAIGHAPGGVGGELVAAGVVGGVGSELAGGKFEDGFVTGVFGRGFNDCLHGGCSGFDKVKSWFTEKYNKFNDVYEDFKDIRSRGHQNFPGQDNSDIRHTAISYELSLKYDDSLVRAAGVVNEIQGLVLHDIPNLPSRLNGSSPWAFSIEDLLANEIGITAAGYEGLGP